MYRPFYVVAPSIKDRETCLCKLHENGKLILERMGSLALIPQNIKLVEQVVQASICDTPNMSCYERNCSSCKNKLTIFGPFRKDTVSWYEWQLIKENRIISGKNVVLKRTVKNKIINSEEKLVETFNQLRFKLCWHLMVMRHQFKSYHFIKNQPASCLIVIDFSENYTCKQNRSVQSAHFGASNQQITLHTGVAYIGSTIFFLGVFRIVVGMTQQLFGLI